MFRNGRATIQITLTLTGLSVVAIALVAGFTWLATQEVDDLSLARERELVSHGVEEQIRSVPREQESVTIWDDAVLQTNAGNSRWMADNFGRWLHDYFGVDRSYVLDDRDRLTFAMRDGAVAAVPSFGGEKTEVSRIVAELRRSIRLPNNDGVPLADRAKVEVHSIDGRPAVISVRPIIPGTHQISVAPEKLYLSIVVKFLDKSTAGYIQKHAHLQQVHYVADLPEQGHAVAPIVSTAGYTLGYLTWKPLKPGMTLLKDIAPTAIIGMVFAAGVVFFLSYGLIKTSYHLSQSKQQLLRHRDELEETVRLRTMEIERQAKELDRLLAQEREANALQRQFVTMASHEFRTPLAIIDAAAQRLTRSRSDISQDYIAEKTVQIRDAVKRMVQLMESILSAGRLGAGQLEMRPQDCDLQALIGDCHQRIALIGKTHRFHHDLEGLPPSISADKGLIDQVFTNLLSNAVKYAPNAPDIFIRGWEEAGQVCVSIRDQGIGMDASDIPNLFKPYFRARSAAGIAGTGIGLNLAKDIVEMHGGTIAVASELGKGTTFTIRLPIKNAGAQSRQAA
jgi:signal transduction histidine kinase